ncbi:MAG: ArnT family glycosyltransferase, partial [Gemmataceae bacterium]
LLLGRRLGLLSALILATMQEFVRYAVDPEADIFLCTVVTAALALFVRLELGQPTQDAEPATFFGRRPWQVLVFFLLLGATNWIKGLIFGTLMVLVPTTVFALCRFKRDGLRRYVWFWGWLAFSVVWLAWPVAVWLRQPDAIDLWHSDYFGRLNGGYVGEPGYYYALALSWVLLPWTIPALLGFCLVRARAWRQAASVERWLCIWALSVPLVFSIPDGKHHHYLLSALAPWAMLAALGTRSGWRWLSARPPWFAPACGLTLGVGLDLALYWLRERVKGPAALVVLALLLIPFLGGLVGWILSRRDHRLALGSTFLLLAACHGVNSLHQAWYRCGYREENHFLAACQELVPEGSPLYINHDRHCLENFRLLFYIRARQPVLLLNASFLRDDRIEQETIYVLARQRDIPELAAYGDVGRLRTSASYRDWADDPRVLLRLRFRGDLKRCSCQTHVTAMQAAYRAPGPYLK